MKESPAMLVLLSHSPDWEHRYQLSAAAAAAASSGREVRVVFFFRALEVLLAGDWDRPPALGNPYAGRELQERVEELELVRPSELLTVARRSGRCQLLACSASLALIGRRDTELRERVDEIVGWPTIVQWMHPPAQILYF